MSHQSLLSAALQVPRYILAALAGITVVLAFTPLLPNMPSTGLDPSWAYAMNEATALRLAFGKELIFTFGPYAAIYTKVYHPGTDSIILFGGFLIGTCSAGLLLLLTRGASLVWAFIFCVIIIAITHVRDPLFFSYPLLLTLAIYRITLPEDNKYAISLPKKMEILFACLLLPLGLISLIKGGYLVISVLISALCFAIFWYIGRKTLAYYSLTFPLVSAVFFWLLSGQSLLDIPHYFLNMKQLISGYTEAMATKGKTLEIAYYLIAATGILYIIATSKNTLKYSRVFLFTAIASILFFAFKGGFVRHDIHAIIASTTIIIIAILLKLAVEHRHLNLIIVLCFISWFYTDKRHVSTSTTNVYTSIKDFYKNANNGIKVRRSNNETIIDSFNKNNLIINRDHRIPLLDGTTDIYSYNQSYLIASGNIWSPRPIFQSYTVYTPKLAKINEKHLNSSRAPDNIIFKVEAIDGRLPALEDGRSWPTIIYNYSPVSIDNDFLILKKNGPSNSAAALSEIYNNEHQLGHTFDIPETNSAIFAEIDIQQTIFGHLLSFLLKPQELSISIEMFNGQKTTYKMISTMAKAGFIVSPFIEDTNDFIFLFYKNQFQDRKYVKSINISPTNGNSIFWRDTFSVKFSHLDLPDNDNVTELKDTIAPDNIYAVLTDKTGERKLINAHITPSPDLSTQFKKPKSPDVRFKFMADISKLDGDFQFTMARVHSDNLALCEQARFSFPINLKPSSSK